jgi:hypothetical protein
MGTNITPVPGGSYMDKEFRSIISAGPIVVSSHESSTQMLNVNVREWLKSRTRTR